MTRWSMGVRVLALLLIAGWTSGWATDTAAQGMSEMAQRFNRMGTDAMNNSDWPDCIENFTQVVVRTGAGIDPYFNREVSMQIHGFIRGRLNQTSRVKEE